MNKKKRSLASLIEKYQSGDIISSIEKEHAQEKIEYVPLEKVKFNPIAKNQFFLDKRLKDLNASIQKNGVVSPILVRLRDGIYEVCSGYKRFYVAKKLHLKEIPVNVKDISDDLLIYMVLSRGYKKQHDNILNKTYSYQILTRDYHVSRKDIATISRQSISQVTNILRLNNLDEEVKLALKKEKIYYGQAKVLLGLDNQTQLEFLNKITSTHVSVREIENEVRELKKPSPYKDRINHFEKQNNCKVSLTEKGINIKFDNNEELINFLNNYKD